MEMSLKAVLEKIIRVGKVSSVDVDSRTVRVVFADRQDGDGNPLISGALKVVQNTPLITVEKWVEELPGKWDFKADYNSHEREIKIGENYVKNKYTSLKDIIENKKEIEGKTYKEIVTVYPWLPYVGQFVVCLFLPNGEGDGFVLGGI